MLKRLFERLSGRLVVLGCCLVLGLSLLGQVPGRAAERIYFDFGILGRSVAVADLEQFAQTGELEGTLGYFLRRFTNPDQQDQLRELLQTRYPVEPLLVDRFSYTSSGVRLFGEIGDILQTESRQNGGQAIRSAAILAAGQPEGISILSFLQQFPTDIRIDLRRLLALVNRVTEILRQTEQAVVQFNQQTEQIAAQTNRSFPEDLRQLGPFAHERRTLQIRDAERQRQFAADLYLPETEAAPLPVIVMSNGLGAGRDRFDEIALHLVTHGFAIAIPDHPGSDRQRLREFYAGLQRENFDASEYLDRPRDITALLDELERLNQTQLNQRLSLERVGMFGYSFGGSTALSLAGATLNPQFLESDCQTELGLVNISLLYQCRALELPAETLTQSLKDERIAAAFLFVPFGKSLFGPNLAQIEIPIFWQVTDLDILTPLAVEQLPAFAALTPPDRSSPDPSPDHYLAVTQGLPHARVTYDALGRLTGSPAPWETLKQIAHDYQNALSLAFFRLYISGSEADRAYLTPAYAQVITQPPYRLSLLSAPDLTQGQIAEGRIAEGRMAEE